MSQRAWIVGTVCESSTGRWIPRRTQRSRRWWHQATQRLCLYSKGRLCIHSPETPQETQCCASDLVWQLEITEKFYSLTRQGIAFESPDLVPQKISLSWVTICNWRFLQSNLVLANIQMSHALWWGRREIFGIFRCQNMDKAADFCVNPCMDSCVCVWEKAQFGTSGHPTCATFFDVFMGA